jgi:uncharacterized protein (TIGR02996 family)
MNMEEALLAAIHEAPDDDANWLVLADWLDDQNDPRAELLRLTLALCAEPEPQGPRAGRLRALLADGIVPCVPVLTNSIGMRLALVPAGAFFMGARKNEPKHSDDELPRHQVRITGPFYLGVHQVTQEQYDRVVGNNPSYFAPSGPAQVKVQGCDTRALPVENVSWDDAVTFCARLSALPAEKAAGRTYHLPTEAQWERACRGAVQSATHFGDSLSALQANFDGNYPFGRAGKGPYLERPAPVGSYPPNAFGLYDMHGNVWEWCADWYHPSTYSYRRRPDPGGRGRGPERVQRGGSWFSYGWACRAAERCRSLPEGKNERTGFRVALTVRSPAEALGGKGARHG